MPVDLEARCKRTLDEIVNISNAIRRLALAHATHRNLDVSETLRHQLETIRISADTILEAVTKASLTDLSLDDRVIDWLLSGEPRACLERLREMDVMFMPSVQSRPLARPFQLAEDKISAAKRFFDNHSGLFHFLITPNIWDHETLLRQPLEAPQVDMLPAAGTTMSHQVALTSSFIVNNTATERVENTHNTIHVPTRRRLSGVHQQKLDEVSRWLAAFDCTAKHDYTLQLKREGTCTWFPKTDAFQQWRTGQPQLLWLHGKAGCGKSVLAASMIEHLKTTLNDDEVLLFFYCDFQDKRSTHSAEVMRSLLSQLIHHFRDHCVNPGDLPNKILEKKRKHVLSLNDPDKLCDMVSSAAICFPCEPIVVIDALDECTDIEALLRALLILNRGDVRLLVTSRPHPIIVSHFSGHASLSFEDLGRELAEDIALHVKKEVDSHARLRAADTRMKNEIRTKLSEKAEGRFRWVQCQLDILRQCKTGQEWKEALNNLPTELESTYERILDAIDARRLEGKLARRTLALLVVALEPLSLAQIVDGISVHLSLPRRADHKPGWPGGRVLDALSSLVTYHQETDAIVLSHYSVKEYLIGRAALPENQVNPHATHAEVAQMCMHYISAFINDESPCRDVGPLESWPMLSYVLSSGFRHLSHVAPGSTATLEALKSLGIDVHRHPTHWDRLCELREEDLRWPYPPWPTSRHNFVVYFMIAYSSVELFRTFLSSKHVKPKIRINPLVYAADLRKTNHAIALLTCSAADVDAHGIVIDDSRDATPLEVAIDLGDDVLVGELLQRGSVVTPEILSTAICMPWCSVPILVQLMASDAFVAWARDIGDEKLYRGVFNSARPNSGDRRKTDEDYVLLSRRLHAMGVDFSADSPFVVEIIERAVFAAYTSLLEYLLPPHRPPPARYLLVASTCDTPETVTVICFLLRKGVDVHAVSDASRDTALHLAVMCPWEPRCLQLTQMLVDAGCSPHVQNVRGETPLTIAIQRGYFTVVEHLLSTGEPLPSDILSITLRLGAAPRMIIALIRKGADIDVITPVGDSVLHLAIANYNELMCLYLVQHFGKAGCDLGTRNYAGKTVLSAAMERGYTSVASYLLSCNVSIPPDILPLALQQQTSPQLIRLLILSGAVVNSAASDADTVLHLAIVNYAESACLDLVKRFIDAGCNPETCIVQGNTVLAAAIQRGYMSVVEVLLSRDIFLPSELRSILLQPCPFPPSWMREGTGTVISTWNTVLRLSMTWCSESVCLYIVRGFIKAGCMQDIRAVMGDTSLVIAVERGHESVVELLLSYTFPCPNDILLTAPRRRATARMIGLLLHNSPRSSCRHAPLLAFDWGVIVQLVNASYAGEEREQVLAVFDLTRLSVITSRAHSTSTALETVCVVFGQEGLQKDVGSIAIICIVPLLYVLSVLYFCGVLTKVDVAR